MSERMLTQELWVLKQDGIVRRTVCLEVPPRVDYSLAAFGDSLRPIRVMLNEWGEKHRKRIEER